MQKSNRHGTVFRIRTRTCWPDPNKNLLTGSGYEAKIISYSQHFLLWKPGQTESLYLAAREGNLAAAKAGDVEAKPRTQPSTEPIKRTRIHSTPRRWMGFTDVLYDLCRLSLYIICNRGGEMLADPKLYYLHILQFPGQKYKRELIKLIIIMTFTLSLLLWWPMLTMKNWLSR